jgi:hypothetical protein
MGTTETETAQASGLSEEVREHYRMVALALADGEVVPFLGAGVNLCGRPSGEHFKLGEWLPSGAELAEYLARRCGYPLPDADNLVRVTQYQVTMQDEGPLYKRLHEVFNADYRPTHLHGFLARLPQTLKQKFGTARNQLIITTNYDDALERAFAEAKQPYDLFTYLAFGEDAGKFVHTAPDGKRHVVSNPKRFSEPLLEQRPVILKIHGAVDRADSRRDSYVITEDDYIEFLQRTEISKLIPVSLIPAMQSSHFLFLGYSLRDWNLRVILQRIWEEQDHGWSSWAVQHQTNPIDQKFWMKRGVDIQVVDLQDYVRGLDAALNEIATENEAAA